MDNLRRKNERLEYKNNIKLDEDETLSSSFESAIVLWALYMIDPRLPLKVEKKYSHQMVGNTTLIDLQATIFQNVKSMLSELDSETHSSCLAAHSQQTSLNAFAAGRGAGGYRKRDFTTSGRGLAGRGRGNNTSRSFSRNKFGNSRPRQPFCRMCKLAGSQPSIFKSHEIGECELLTEQDVKSIVAKLNRVDLQDMITSLNKVEVSEGAKPEPFNEPGWDDPSEDEEVDDR